MGLLSNLVKDTLDDYFGKRYACSPKNGVVMNGRVFHEIWTGSNGPPRQGVCLMGGDCLSLAPPGSSGPPRQGVGLTGGDCVSLAPPGSSGPPRQSVGGSLSLFPFLSSTRVRHSCRP